MSEVPLYMNRKALREVTDSVRGTRTVLTERIIIELMTSDRKLKASRNEGTTGSNRLDDARFPEKNKTKQNDECGLFRASLVGPGARRITASCGTRV